MKLSLSSFKIKVMKSKEKFYKMLADKEISKQIIIFDNEEPSEEIKGKISYLHFSGEASIGRKGLYID